MKRSSACFDHLASVGAGFPSASASSFCGMWRKRARRMSAFFSCSAAFSNCSAADIQVVKKDLCALSMGTSARSCWLIIASRRAVMFPPLDGGKRFSACFASSKSGLISASWVAFSQAVMFCMAFIRCSGCVCCSASLMSL